MRVIIPMAGAGSRFAVQGYTDPKPFIMIRDRPMLAWALDPIPLDWEILAVCRAEDAARLRGLRELGGRRVEILPLPGPTQGAACTVLAAALTCPPLEPIAVMNADQTFTYDLASLQATATGLHWDGYVLTFHGTGNRWSYVRAEDGWVKQVAEKVEISGDATVGFYYFRQAHDLIVSCCTDIATEERTRGEFFVAPVFNNLIARGGKVRAVRVEDFRGLGTPEDVTAFERTAWSRSD